MQVVKDDEQLLEEFRSKDTRERAFEQIIRKYQERLYYMIRRMVHDHDDTDDILQQVFIKAWKNLERFRSESGLYTWLYRIASNETMNFLNKRKKTERVPLDDISHGLEATSNDGPDGATIQQKLLDAIDTLPKRQRMVFNLKYFEEMKYEEMSTVLDTSVGALKASYHHAVKKIENFLVQD